MSIEAFRDAYSRAVGAATFIEQQTSGLTAGQYTQYFNGTPQGGKACSLGILLQFNATLTATGAQTPAGGTDLLDLFLSLVQVCPAPATGARAEAITRQFAEFVWAATTNTVITVGACPTFASASSAAVSITVFIPIGGLAGAVRIQLPAAITSVYAANVTISYTSVNNYVVSSDFTGVVAFKEELSASLGTGSLVSIAAYTPATVAPDAVFMKGESSTTITQVLITTGIGKSNRVWVNSTNTSVLQLGAQQFAPISGATFTTTAGFVIVGNQEAFSTFQVNFASGTTHYIGYIQVAGGETVLPNKTPGPTSGEPAVSKTGGVTESGQVTAAKPGTGGSAGGGGQGGYAAYRSRARKG